MTELRCTRYGHLPAVHYHLRRGTDCGICGPGRCGRYRRHRTLTQLVKARP